MTAMTPEHLDSLAAQARDDATCFYCERPASSARRCGLACEPVVTVTADVLTALVEAARDRDRATALAESLHPALEALRVERDEARRELAAQVARWEALHEITSRDPDCRCEEAREDGAPCVVHGYPSEPHTHTMYGGFNGGDPRSFTPDPECSTDEEREAHRAACSRWDAGARDGVPVVDEPGSGAVVDLMDAATGERVGGAFVHVRRFGLGVNQWDCTDPACDEGQPRDPREPSAEEQVDADRRAAADAEALAGDDGIDS